MASCVCKVVLVQLIRVRPSDVSVTCGGEILKPQLQRLRIKNIGSVKKLERSILGLFFKEKNCKFASICINAT